MTRVPSNAADTRTFGPPCAGEPHATVVIRDLPAAPAALDLNTITSFWARLLLTSHILKVLSVPAVTHRSLLVGCHAPEVTSEMCPLVLFMSRRYISPLTNSVSSSPSRLNILACGIAVMTSIWLGDSGLKCTWWTGCVSVLAECFVSVGSTDRNARSVVGVIDEKSW